MEWCRPAGISAGHGLASGPIWSTGEPGRVPARPVPDRCRAVLMRQRLSFLRVDRPVCGRCSLVRPAGRRLTLLAGPRSVRFDELAVAAPRTAGDAAFHEPIPYVAV